MKANKLNIRHAASTALLVAVSVSAAAPVDSASVPESDRLQFTQKDAQAQMQELQDRMFHLAEVSREAEPDNATRLLLAVRKAREELIMEQMRSVAEQLASKDLGHATEESKAVLQKLEDLRALLIATDLDLQLQLERLRQLNATIKKLDNAIKEEKQEQGHSGELAKKPDVKPGELEQAKGEQENNHKRADEVADAVKAMGNLDGAAQSLGESGKSMAQAEGNLGGGKAGDASSEQGDAAGKMGDARAQLEAQRQKLLKEVQKQIKRVVMENLQQMLDRETALRTATAALSPRLAKDRAAFLQLQQLAPAQEHIATLCQQTMDVVNETEFSVALPAALENVQHDMLYVAGDLTAGRGDQRVIATEDGILADLRDLIETFKELENKNKEGNPQDGNGGKQNARNQLAAELKVIRMMQLRVNMATADADGDAHRAAAAAELPAELRDKIGRVRDNEDAVRNAMELLHERFGPNAHPPEEEGGDVPTV